MRRFLALVLMALAIPDAARGAVALSIDVGSAAGTTLVLDAGTWRVELAGTDAWNSAGGLVSVCDPVGAQCKKGWTTQFGVDLGYGIGQFNRSEGLYLGMTVPGHAASLFASPQQAVAAGQSGPVYAAPIDQLYQFAAWQALAEPILLTLPEAQSVNFFVADEDHANNVGGLALRLAPWSPAPEPQGWALMLAGLSVIAARLRRQAARRACRCPNRPASPESALR